MGGSTRTKVASVVAAVGVGFDGVRANAVLTATLGLVVYQLVAGAAGLRWVAAVGCIGAGLLHDSRVLARIASLTAEPVP